MRVKPRREAPYNFRCISEGGMTMLEWHSRMPSLFQPGGQLPSGHAALGPMVE